MERGFDYYLEDRVSDFYFSDKTIEAAVEGSEDYRVRILLGNGEITDMFCSCPYASDGTPCKHMAAVLYEYDDALDEETGTESFDQRSDTKGNDGKRASSELTIDEMLANADADLVRRFLLEVLRKH